LIKAVLKLAFFIIIFNPFTVHALEVLPSLVETGEKGIEGMAYYTNISQEIVFDIQTTTVTSTGEQYTDTVRIYKEYFIKKALIRISLHRSPGYDIFFLGGVNRASLKEKGLSEEMSGGWTGYTLGFGAKYILLGDLTTLPQTVLNVKISRDLSPLTEYTPPSRGSLDSVLTVYQVQVSAIVSKKFSIFLPYTGLEGYYGRAAWEKKSSKSEREEGRISGLSMLAGIKVIFTPALSLSIEGTFLGDASYALGMNILFR